MFNRKTSGYDYQKLNTNENDFELKEIIFSNENSEEDSSISNSIMGNKSYIRKSNNEDKINPQNDDALKDVEIYEVDIDGADGPQSLQTIAMKYNCSTWELKRVNNLQNNQDFFALRTIKVAAMKNSYRSELLQRHGRLLTDEGIHCLSPYQSSSQSGKPDGDNSTDDSEVKPTLVRHISIRSSISNDTEGGYQFLRNMDSDLQKIRESVNNQKTSLEEVSTMLTTPTIFPPSNSQRNTAATQMFIDLFKEPYCEITGKRLVAIVFLGFAVIPIVLIIVITFIKLYPSKT